MKRKKISDKQIAVCQRSNFLLYAGNDGRIQIEVFVQDESVWLTQKRMAELFSVDVRTISEHLRNIFGTNELDEAATVRKFRTVQKEGTRDVSRELDFYNLDAIIAVGYRVNSYQATQFRIWATKTLKEFIIKGFVLDDERLKQGKTVFGKDYFEELLERIREIRASERRFYQKITDLYALSADYDPDSPITEEFSPRYRTDFIGRLPARRLRKSSTITRTRRKSTWALPVGSMHRTVKY
ncbi:MAG: virulence RhuM family protein [Chitinispirillaceae bacterium]|nr:virulence RhuM family protein [Chitinispirillaceae bacterium]